MKKLSLIVTIAIIFTALFSTSVSSVKIGDKLGDVLNTDIKVYINDHQIPAYAVNNKMAVVMEDLRGYGFDVKYDNSARTLSANRNMTKEFKPIKNIEVNAKKPGSVAFPYVYTDIKAYLGNKQIECFAIDGNMCIYVDDLKDYGKFVWDNETRKLYLTYSPPKTPSKYDFLYSYAEYTNNTKQNTAITQIVMCFFGEYYYLNPDDFTDIILKKDGKIILNRLPEYTITSFHNNYENGTIKGIVTYFVFKFNKEINESGIYNFSGKYKGVPLDMFSVVIENYTIGNTPANPNDLYSDD